mgnify:CR=1 FL=1
MTTAGAHHRLADGVRRAQGRSAPQVRDRPDRDAVAGESPGGEGRGEAGAIASTPAVANAVHGRAEPFGIVHLDLPLTPQRVWNAIQDARAKGRADHVSRSVRVPPALDRARGGRPARPVRRGGQAAGRRALADPAPRSCASPARSTSSTCAASRASSGVREDGWDAGGGRGDAARATLERSPLVRERLPMLAEAAAQIGDPQVRNMGTIGGSLAHADPAADLPAVMLALGATLVALGPKQGAADDRPSTASSSSCSPPCSVRTSCSPRSSFPLPGHGDRRGLREVPSSASRYAIVGVAAQLTLQGGKISAARIGITRGRGEGVPGGGGGGCARSGKCRTTAAFSAAAAKPARPRAWRCGRPRGRATRTGGRWRRRFTRRALQRAAMRAALVREAIQRIQAADGSSRATSPIARWRRRCTWPPRSASRCWWRGHPGVGKTEIAKVLATALERRPDPPAVLRGPRRHDRAVRVELPAASCSHIRLEEGSAARRWPSARRTSSPRPFLLQRPAAPGASPIPAGRRCC